MKNVKSFIMGVSGILLFAVGFYLLKTFTDPQGIMKPLPFLLIGLGCGMFGHELGDFLSRLAVKKDPEIARQIEIDQKDERNIMLSNMAKAKGYDTMTYVFAALILAYALMGASIEIIIPFVIAFLFVQFYTIYVRAKNDKEH